MTLNINLNNIDYHLFNNSFLNISNKCSLIYGKNASGKSTIADCVNNQFNDNGTSVYVFRKNLVETNKELNELFLGQRDIHTNLKIKNLCNKIVDIKKAMSILSEQKDHNKKDYDTYRDSIKNWYSNCARKLKYYNHGELVAPNYILGKFKKDADRVNVSDNLNSNELKKYQDGLKDTIYNQTYSNCSLPNIKINKIVNNANNLLDKYVAPRHISNLEGLSDHNRHAKIQFALTGMKIHNKGDICAFCGNKITNSRWMKLHDFFNKKYLNFEKEINKMIESIKHYKGLLKFKELVPEEFSSQLKNNIKLLNGRVYKSISYYQNLLDTLINDLEIKRENTRHVFKCHNPIKSSLLFPQLRIEIKNIYKENDKYKYTETKRKEKYKHIILLNYVYKMTRKFKYPNKKKSLRYKYNKFLKSSKDLQVLNSYLSKLYLEKIQILRGVESKNIVIRNVNNFLDLLNDNSFRLYCDNNKKQYYIASKYDRRYRRSISNLSRGELKLISFLYFYYSVSPNNSNNNSENKIVIFDDPVDGEDTEFRYIAANLMRNFINKINNDVEFNDYHLIIFTHDMRFYLNMKNGFTSHYLQCIHLIKMKNFTNVNYVNSNIDFNTDYQGLWYDVKSLYYTNQPRLMLIPITQIVDIYTRNNNLNRELFYSNCERAHDLFSLISNIARVPKNIDKDKVKDDFKQLFYNNGDNSKNHFNKYWNMFLNK